MFTPVNYKIFHHTYEFHSLALNFYFNSFLLKPNKPSYCISQSLCGGISKFKLDQNLHWPLRPHAEVFLMMSRKVCFMERHHQHKFLSEWIKTVTQQIVQIGSGKFLQSGSDHINQQVQLHNRVKKTSWLKRTSSINIWLKKG